jgi:hypothetical protein
MSDQVSGNRYQGSDRFNDAFNRIARQQVT